MSKYKVGDKFVIEIEEVLKSNIREDIDSVYTPLFKIKGFNSLIFDKNGLNRLSKLEESQSDLYNKGINDAWNIARELCEIGYRECIEIFGDEAVEYAINKFTPLEVKEKIESYKREKEFKPGDRVIDINDDTKGIVLDENKHTDTCEKEWIVYTENGCVEYWFECDVEKIGDAVDLSRLF